MRSEYGELDARLKRFVNVGNIRLMKKGKLDELFKYGRQEVTALAENFSQMQQMTKVSPSGQPERLRRLKRLANSLWLALLGAGVGGIEYAQSKTGRNAHGANPTAPGCPQPQHSLSLSLSL